MEIYVLSIDGKIEDIVIEPSSKEVENLYSMCDDRCNVRKITNIPVESMNAIYYVKIFDKVKEYLKECGIDEV